MHRTALRHCLSMSQLIVFFATKMCCQWLYRFSLLLIYAMDRRYIFNCLWKYYFFMAPFDALMVICSNKNQGFFRLIWELWQAHVLLQAYKTWLMMPSNMLLWAWLKGADCLMGRPLMLIMFIAICAPNTWKIALSRFKISQNITDSHILAPAFND